MNHNVRAKAESIFAGQTGRERERLSEREGGVFNENAHNLPHTDYSAPVPSSSTIIKIRFGCLAVAGRGDDSAATRANEEASSGGSSAPADERRRGSVMRGCWLGTAGAAIDRFFQRKPPKMCGILRETRRTAGLLHAAAAQRCCVLEPYTRNLLAGPSAGAHASDWH